MIEALGVRRLLKLFLTARRRQEYFSSFVMSSAERTCAQNLYRRQYRRQSSSRSRRTAKAGEWPESFYFAAIHVPDE